MKTLFGALIAVALATAGCTHTRDLGYGEGQTQPETLFRSLKGESVAVRSSRTGDLEGILIEGRTDSIILQQVEPPLLTRIPTAGVDSIIVSGSGNWPFWGALGGLLVGGLLGSAIGSSISPQGEMSPNPFIGGVIGGAAGLAAGLVIGLEASATETYRLTPAWPVPGRSESGHAGSSGDRTSRGCRLSLPGAGHR